MILLIDNKEFAIEFCKDEDDERNVFIENGYPGWKGKAAFLSDIGKRVFLHGAEAEEWLDSSNIYYIHLEEKEGECYLNFICRLFREIHEHKNLIARSHVVDGKGAFLEYGIAKGFAGEATFDTDNVLEIVRESDGTYHTTLSIGDDKSIHEAIAELKSIIAKAESDLGKTGFGVEEDDFYDDVNLSVSHTVAEAISKLKMRLGIMVASAGGI